MIYQESVNLHTVEVRISVHHHLDAGMDYGRPMKLLIIKIPNFWAWADNLGR